MGTTYLIMECHEGFAVALDEEGRFFKVANRNYEPGQHVEHVIIQKEPKADLQKKILSFTSMAACLCILLAGTAQLMIFPVGSVNVKINPEIQVNVNRLDYVVGTTALNSDGEKLLENYSYFGKKVDTAIEELALIAQNSGYLTDGGQISLKVSSNNEKWKLQKESALSAELEKYLEYKVEIVIEEDVEEKDEQKETNLLDNNNEYEEDEWEEDDSEEIENVLEKDEWKMEEETDSEEDRDSEEDDDLEDNESEADNELKNEPEEDD